MRKKKPNSKKKWFIIPLIVLLSLVASSLACVLTHKHIVTTQSLFLDFDDPMDVRGVLVSEFSIGETSRAEVEESIDNGTLGLISCREYIPGTFISETVILCDTRASVSIIFPQMFGITFGFNDDILAEVEVISYIKGAI